MKKKLTQLRWLATIILFVAAMAMPKMAWAEITPAKPTNGDGTSGSPYEISNAAELYWFAALVNGDTSVDGVTAADKTACAKLTANIVVNTGVLKSDGSLTEGVSGLTSWTPINSDYENSFTGTFDGCNYTISGLYVNGTDDFVGLFGHINGAVISNVGIVDSYICGRRGVAAVCGYCVGEGGSITNCYNTGTVKGEGFVGGICGYSGTAIIEKCHNTGNIIGTSTSQDTGFTGGICGCSDKATFTKSYNTGDVRGNYLVGGICGSNGFNYSSDLTYCYNTGTINGPDNCNYEESTGGIAGYNHGNIKYCYNIGTLSGGNYKGNICGINGHKVAMCIYIEKADGLNAVGSGKGETDAQAKTSNQFANGEVCYQLNAVKNVHVWRQNIGSDNFPVLDESHGIVYASSPCPVNFSNTQSDVSETTEHNYVDGVCTACNASETEPEVIDDVYQLKTQENLYWFAEQVNSGKDFLKAVLANDITVNTGSLSATTTEAKKWTPIGKRIAPYKGIFNGQGHTISGLYFNDTSKDSEEYIGLFGNLGSGGEISNVGVVNSYFSGIRFVGGVCADNEGKISNCYALGELHGGYKGGVCANNEGEISNCYASCTISGDICGGISYSNSGQISNCYASCTISGNMCGGISAYNSGAISNCYFDNENFSGVPLYHEEEGSYYTKVEGKSKSVFKSGEVAYLLNESKSDGTQKWFQNLSEDDGDAYPVLKSTETNTVYKGYWHGETSTSYRNRCHEHAYDSSASNEQNGNHDKSYQGVFTWTDNEDKTNATVTATFTCSKCGKMEKPELAAVHDESNTNTVANCTEDGYNYYKTSYSFTGETFSSTYRQTLPALGHDMTEITLVDKIYQNECQREGCDHKKYYATSDGSVKAQLEGGIYKVASFNLADATEYDSGAEFTATSLAYKRTFYDDKWVAVYVPFEINCDNLANDFEMAVVNNFHEYEQTDGSYNVVLEVKRMTSGTIPALTPCVMRMKTAPASATEKEIQLSNVPFSAAADNYIDCSSVTRYYKFTGSLAGKSGFDEASDFVPLNGDVVRASGDTNLEPQRWFLTATNRGSTTPLPVGLQRIAIRVMGDNEGEGGGTITSIDTLHLIEGLYTESGRIVCAGEFRIYDLLGRDVTRLNGSLCGVYVVKVGEAAVKVVVK